tara:strand:- start:781 stop:969 length:189 start_codon:yes stop_codon:yes gene_type:complete
MSSYKKIIVELAVYIDKDEYIHKGKSIEEIVERELEAIEEQSGIYIERFISDDEIVENDEEK